MMKLSSFFIGLALACFNVFFTPELQAEMVIIHNQQGHVGDDITITFTISNAANTVSAMGFDVLYDSSILEYIGFSPGPLLDQYSMCYVNQVHDDCLRLGALEHNKNIKPHQSGELIVLTFHVIDFGTSEIELVRPKDDIRNWQIQNGIFKTIDETDPENQNLFYQFKQLWPALKQPWYFYHPMDIAVDLKGFVYVADTWNDQVQKLTDTGQVVTKWGGNGFDEGQFQTPVSLATYQDTTGVYVFVVDQYNHRIQKFTDTGEYIQSWGTYGANKGQFQSPSGIAVDKEGFIYVADTGNSRIQKFTASGEWYQEWTSEVNTRAQMLSPCAIAIDHSGNIYVADSESQSVIKFSNNGKMLQSFSTATSNQFSNPVGIAIIKLENSEIIMVSDSGNDRILSFNLEGSRLADQETILQKLESALSYPAGIASDHNKIYIADASNNRIVPIQINPEIAVGQWGSQGTQKGSFIRPSGVDVSTSHLLVSSGTSDIPQKHHFIQKFTTTGSFLEKWPNLYNNEYTLNSPSDVAQDENNYYVLDSGNHRLLQFDTNGRFQKSWGQKGRESGELDFPCGMALYDNFIYVADTGNHRIQIFDRTGQFIHAWGEKGTFSGQFIMPKDIDIDPDGIVYVADTGNHRIQCFSIWGEFLDEWGEWGHTNGEFDTPSGIAVHPDESIVVVADTGNHRCQVFNKDGDFITKFGTYGSGAGQFHEPFHLDIDLDKNIYISDRINNRIQKFQPVTLEDGIVKAIIVVGDDTYGDALFQTNANLAYRALNYQGINKNNIYYLSKDIDLDLDDNGVTDDIDALATNENLEGAVTDWATDAQHLIIYLIGHNDLYFRMNSTEILDNTQLDQWIDQLQIETGCRVSFIFDACKSGNFVQVYAAPDSYSRVVITSTGVDENSYLIGAISFSNYFWTHIFNGFSIQTAFQLASQTTSQINQPPFMSTPQNPLMDANNNGISNEPVDYSLTQDLYFGSKDHAHSETIEIVSVSDAITLTQETSSILKAEVISDPSHAIQRVWAVIRRPDYQAGVSGTIEIELISVGNHMYQSVYQEFDTTGSYLIAFYAQDDTNQVSIPNFTTISVNTPTARRAIIVVGETFDEILDPYFETIAAAIYDTLLFQGFTDETIYVMIPTAFTKRWDGLPNASNIQYAFDQWTKTDHGENATQDLVVCFLGKTKDSNFVLNYSETISQEQIDLKLDQLEKQIPGKILLVSDMSGAWKFISQSALSGSSRRIHISGSSENDNETLIAMSQISFSTFFWQRVLNGFDVKSAFKAAKDALNVLNQYQVPCIEANGNGNANEYDDYVSAREFTIGYGIMRAQDTVTIASVTPPEILSGETNAMIWAKKIVSTSLIEKVWAIIVPPGFRQTDNTVIDQFPEIELLYNTSTDRYEAIYSSFKQFGTYRIAVYAKSTNGMTSIPVETVIYQTKAPDPYENLSDNAFEQAQHISVNDTEAQQHNFHNEQDHDWVKFYALAGNIYNIFTNNADLNSDPVIALYDQDGVTKLDESNYGVGNEQEVINWICTKDGIYFVSVNNFNKDATDGQDTGYDLRVNIAATIFNGIINGYVRIQGTEVPIGDVVVRTSKNLADISLPSGTYRIGGHEHGEASIYAEASGFYPYTATIYVNELAITRHDIYMTPQYVPGDLNMDGSVDLQDAILTGYVLSNIDLSEPIVGFSDISTNGKIGIEEMIYILNYVSSSQ